MLIASQTQVNQAGYLASDEARAQAAIDAQIKHNSFRNGLPSMQVVEKEQKNCSPATAQDKPPWKI